MLARLWPWKEYQLILERRGGSQEWWVLTLMGPDSQAHTCTLQSDPSMIKAIVDAVTIPVMAKVRIGHFVEAQVGLSFPHDQSFPRF